MHIRTCSRLCIILLSDQCASSKPVGLYILQCRLIRYSYNYVVQLRLAAQQRRLRGSDHTRWHEQQYNLFISTTHPTIHRSIYLSIYKHKLVASSSLTELAAGDPLLEKVVSSRNCWSICRKLSSWSCWSILGNSSLVKNWSEMMRKLWSQNLLLLRLSIVFFGQQPPPPKVSWNQMGSGQNKRLAESGQPTNR